jgi:hypothetical protein
VPPKEQRVEPEVFVLDNLAEAQDNRAVGHQNVHQVQAACERMGRSQEVADQDNQAEVAPTMEEDVLDSLVVDAHRDLAVVSNRLAEGTGMEEALLENLAAVVYLVAVVHLVVGVFHRSALEELRLGQVVVHQGQEEHQTVSEAHESDLVVVLQESLVAVATCPEEAGSRVDPSNHLEAPCQAAWAFPGIGASSRQVAAHISLFRRHHHHHLYHSSCSRQSQRGSSILLAAPPRV